MGKRDFFGRQRKPELFQQTAQVTDPIQLGEDYERKHVLIEESSNGHYVTLRCQHGKYLLLALPDAFEDPNLEAELSCQSGKYGRNFSWKTASANVLRDLRRSVPTERGHATPESELNEAAELSSGWQKFSEIIQTAHDLGSSDVHIITKADSGVVLLRVDGDLRRLNQFNFARPQGVHAMLKSAFMQSVPGTASTNNLPLGTASATAQNASCQIEFNVRGEQGTSRAICLRVETTTADPSPNGSDTVIRLAAQDALDPRKMLPSLSIELIQNLGYLPDQAQWIEQACQQGQGGIVLAGATGSGKTRTLYTCMGYIALPGKKSISLEDPKEGDLIRVQQISVTATEHRDEDEVFIAAFKSAMRRDPDHLMIGEIRSRASANAFIQTCITGHLGLTSTHAQSAIAVFDRLSFEPINIAIENLTSPDVFNAIVHQVLVQRLCDHCKQPALSHLAADQLKLLEKLGDPARVYVRNPAGCEACRQRTPGVQGRTVCAEVLIPHEPLLQALRRKDFTLAQHIQREIWHQGALRDALQRPDMDGKTAMEAAIYKMFSGQVEFDQVQSQLKNFNLYLKQLGVAL